MLDRWNRGYNIYKKKIENKITEENKKDIDLSNKVIDFSNNYPIPTKIVTDQSKKNIERLNLINIDTIDIESYLKFTQEYKDIKTKFEEYLMYSHSDSKTSKYVKKIIKDVINIKQQKLNIELEKQSNNVLIFGLINDITEKIKDNIYKENIQMNKELLEFLNQKINLTKEKGINLNNNIKVKNIKDEINTNIKNSEDNRDILLNRIKTFIENENISNFNIFLEEMENNPNIDDNKKSNIRSMFNNINEKHETMTFLLENLSSEFDTLGGKKGICKILRNLDPPIKCEKFLDNYTDNSSTEPFIEGNTNMISTGNNTIDNNTNNSILFINLIEILKNSTTKEEELQNKINNINENYSIKEMWQLLKIIDENSEFVLNNENVLQHYKSKWEKLLLNLQNATEFNDIKKHLYEITNINRQYWSYLDEQEQLDMENEIDRVSEDIKTLVDIKREQRRELMLNGFFSTTDTKDLTFNYIEDNNKGNVIVQGTPIKGANFEFKHDISENNINLSETNIKILESSECSYNFLDKNVFSVFNCEKDLPLDEPIFKLNTQPENSLKNVYDINSNEYSQLKINNLGADPNSELLNNNNLDQYNDKAVSYNNELEYGGNYLSANINAQLI